MDTAPAFTAVLFGLRGCLVQAANGAPSPAPGALATLASLRQRQVPCIWLDDLTAAHSTRLAHVLQHADAYGAEPLQVFDLRDGGWQAGAGVAAGATAAAHCC